MDIDFMRDVFMRLAQGIPLTLVLTLASLSIGSVIALVLALMRLSNINVLMLPAQFYLFVFRGTPLLVQVFLVYYGLGQFRPALDAWGVWWLFREPFWCAIIALSMNTGAYASEIIRGGLQSVPQPQIESARSCGMSGFLLFRRIVFPIAVRQALPAYGSEIILMLKSTSLASTITMMEITGIASKLIAETYRAVEVFLVAGAIYLTLNFIITRVVALLEWWLSPHTRPAPTTEIRLETVNE